MIGRAGTALTLALAAAGCGGFGPPSLNDAQQVIANLKFAGTGAPSDLAVTGEFDRRGYSAGDTIGLTVTTNRPASIAVLRVLRGGETTIVFPNKSQPDARAANGAVHVIVPAGKGGVELFEFIAAVDGTSWLFTRTPANGADTVDLGPTTRAVFTDINTTFRGAAHGTVAVAHEAVRVSG